MKYQISCAWRVQTWGGVWCMCGVSRRGGVRRWCWMLVCDACAWRVQTWGCAPVVLDACLWCVCAWCVQTWGCAPQRCRAGPCSDWTCRRYSARTPDATTRTWRASVCVPTCWCATSSRATPTTCQVRVYLPGTCLTTSYVYEYLPSMYCTCQVHGCVYLSGMCLPARYVSDYQVCVWIPATQVHVWLPARYVAVSTCQVRVWLPARYVSTCQVQLVHVWLPVRNVSTCPVHVCVSLIATGLCLPARYVSVSTCVYGYLW